MLNHIKDKIKYSKKIELKNGDIILDIGSNDGSLLRCFDHKKFNLIGIDPTISNLKILS